VVATGASVNGTPVIIGADGVEVDQQKVPLELVSSATESVRAALAQGGYSDIRVVQPATEASPDGLRAAVRGGGLALYFTNNDPAENYFLRITFVGVRLSVDLGPPVGGGAPPAGEPTPASGGTGGAGVLGAAGPAGSVGGPASGTPLAGAPARPVLTSGRRTYDLPAPWRGWPVLVVLGAGAAVAGWVTRRRLLGWWDVNADRYLRG
jgi:hypothetical protein